jgi:hypothetical protein
LTVFWRILAVFGLPEAAGARFLLFLASRRRPGLDFCCF